MIKLVTRAGEVPEEEPCARLLGKRERAIAELGSACRTMGSAAGGVGQLARALLRGLVQLQEGSWPRDLGVEGLSQGLSGATLFRCLVQPRHCSSHRHARSAITASDCLSPCLQYTRSLAP